MPPQQRALVGFLCAVLSVLTFHQGMLLLLRELGWLGIPPTALVWNTEANARAFGLPNIVNQCFWGGLYGVAYGLLAPRLAWPAWLSGLAMGVAATVVGFFVVAALRGQPLAGGWHLMPWLRGLAINGSFGVGLGLIWAGVTARWFPPPLPRR